MTCTQCGYQNPEGSRFCRQCGTPLQASNDAAPFSPPAPQQPIYQQQPSQGAYAPAQQQYPPQYGSQPTKKKKTGLIIGLISGSVVIIAAAVVLVLMFLTGTPVAGKWCCEERGRVLVFNDENTVIGYSLSGTVEADYEYNKSKAEGTINTNGSKYSFTVQKDALILIDEQTDDESTFTKLDENSDVDECVLAAMQGLWSSEEIGEVLKFDDGTVYVYSGYGNFEGAYEYDIEYGEGTFSVNDVDFTFYADYDYLSVTDTGTYEKAAKSLDIDAFVSQYAMPLVGTWYDVSGTYGTVEFYSDWSALLTSYDELIAAAYTFDAATGTGTIINNDSGESASLTLSDNILVIDGVSFTRDYVEQISADDLLPSITGDWYETTGTLGLATFYDDGSLTLTYYGQIIWGTYAYDAIYGTGQVELEIEGQPTTCSLYYDGYTLQIDDYTYTRDYVEPVNTGLSGVWYNVDGMYGTITFYDDGSVLMDTFGLALTGTYEFDASLGVGTMYVSDEEYEYNDSLSLTDDILDVGGIQYIRDYVEQGDYSNMVS